MRIFFWIFSQKVRWRCEISKRNRLFYISHRPNKNLHQQYQIQILLGTTMYFWILQPWNCKSVNPFFTTLVWRKEKGVCINFTKIASNEVVTQKFDCHQQLSSTKVCLWKKWTWIAADLYFLNTFYKLAIKLALFWIELHIAIIEIIHESNEHYYDLYIII